MCHVGRLDDVILLLKSIISEDRPTGVTHTFNKEVLDIIKEAVSKAESPEISLDFNRLEQLFIKEGHVSEQVLIWCVYDKKGV